MSVHNHSAVFLTRPPPPAALLSPSCRLNMINIRNNCFRSSDCKLIIHATIAGSNGSSSGGTAAGGGRDGRVKKKGVPNSNYVVPLDKSLASAYTSCITGLSRRSCVISIRGFLIISSSLLILLLP
ncbi:hypothetical protein NC653_000040 [Populus alba x Populus x berolinensis]|uniref:Uncharacterized protein n=1 Tax=Populus alba x Populus x berolinensis TaxID=444605 RepID=A0AAD6WE05_9ROSI|nr:hypothetical protein NC653_000040 [Populus alba x Populus x berolinensis]